MSCPHYFNGLFLEKNQPGESGNRLTAHALIRIPAATRTAVTSASIPAKLHIAKVKLLQQATYYTCINIYEHNHLVEEGRGSDICIEGGL
jgi:hypothetical protein